MSVRSRWLRGSLRLLVISIVVFVLASLVTYGLGVVSGISPAAFVAGDEATAEDLARISHEWGLDRPLILQYLDWLAGLFRGELGNSWSNGEPVADLLLQKAPISLSVALLALVIGVAGGVGLGVVAAFRQGGAVDRAITWLASIGTAVPAFAIGVLLILVFAVGLKWFPAGGYVPLEEDPALWLWTITLPAVALSFDTIGDLARQVRAGLVGALDGNHVIGAVLQGFSRPRIVVGNVFRNGVGPALSILALKFPTLLGGAVITESVFSMAGYGAYTAKAAQGGDLPVVQGALIVSIVLVLIFNTVVNLVLDRFSPDRRGTL
ncbi:ABC transporter permease [Mycobacterium sp. 236(2023)]|uniref:ABC transporter permease n=1 Tax=Mycobacterium sp. 236(2023) TaxID=3038163 RepID=UPI002414F409|nr:ABC transporter permease [Mycobacterium sp. 236(2023)]MDG4667627.1 ABC transporter permease [Mycobacterium sp. 236(2023)]